MSFLNLAALWTLAIVGPALLILYFLKLRRRQEAVPSTLLWKRAVQDLQVNAPFQRLRKNLLLFLQLLILALAVFALARPIIKTHLINERSVILLIDRSASMNTVEADERTRLELAKEQAVRLVKTFNKTGSRWFSFAGAAADTRVMVIAFADRATVVSPFSTNMGEVADLIGGITPTDAPTRLSEALALAEAYATQTRIEQTPESAADSSRLVLFSDGRIPDAGDLVLRSGTAELVRIGEATDNVGITALRTLRSYERPDVLNVFLQVQNFASQPASTDVSLYINGAIREVQPIELAPGAGGATPGVADVAGAPAAGAAQSISFELTLPTAAVLEARLSRDDALPVDNRAWAVVPPPRKLRVLLVSSGNQFLEAALETLPLDRFVYMTPAEYESAADSALQSDGQSLFDAVICDRHSTARLPRGNYFFIAAAPQIDGVRMGEKLEPHRMIDWDETHPILQHFSLAFLVSFETRALTLPSAAEVLVEGPAGPVLARYAADARQYLLLAFPLTVDATRPPLPLRRDFAMFMYDALHYLGGGGLDLELEPLRPGDTLLVPLPGGATAGRMDTPAGQHALVAGPDGLARFARTERAGLYRVEAGVAGRDAFAVNVADAMESQVAPAGELKIGADVVGQGEAIRASTPEIWRWFVGLALVVAAVEWYIYNRRVML